MDDDASPPAPTPRAVDGRDRAAIRADASARAPFYTGDDWDPDAGGAGIALLDLFADLAAGVVERLDQVPAKHRAAFVDALGFDRRPPQPATLPLTVQVSDGAGGNVHLPGGTRALAAATETHPELTFELEAGFEATPAPLDRLVSVDPRLDHVATHDEALAGEGPSTLFGGPNDQHHDLYLGHPDLLTLGAGTTVQVRLASTADAETLAALEWAYYGETPEGAEADEGWQPLSPTNVEPAPAGPAIDVARVRGILEDHGFELTTDDPEAVERWLVSTLLAREDPDPTPPHVDPDREPAVVDLYHDLDRYVEGVFGDFPPAASASFQGVTLEFSIDRPFVETEQHGVESRWLRARLPPDTPPPLAARLRGAQVRDVELAAGRLQSRADGGTMLTMLVAAVGTVVDVSGFPPDDLLANDVPLEVPVEEGDAPIRPFGTFPRLQDTFYIGSSEAFTKTNQRVTVSYEQAAAIDLAAEPPQVSWEYWDGSAWEFLDVDGETAPAFLDRFGAVSFPVPEDLAPTSVSGHEGHWIRARLVGGGYGELEVLEADDPISGPDDTGDKIWQRLDVVTEPVLDSIRLRYEVEDDDGGTGSASAGGGDSTTSGAGEVPRGLIAEAPAQCYADNNLAVSTVASASTFRPFEGPPDDEQTVYLGFDGQLDGGPLQVFANLADVEYPPGFRPRTRWEVSTDEGWQRVSVRDGTEGLTERGVVRFSPPAETSPLARFGATRHWLRARVTDDRFVGAPYRRRLGNGAGDGGVERCGDQLATTPPGAEAAMFLPETDLVAPNTGLAANVRTVRDEVLGSSDGTADQTFAVASPPVRDATLWVDELATLSAGERDALADDPDVAVERVGDEGDPAAFWVRWGEVEHVRGSGRTDRHFALDPVGGTVTFGDGTVGAIPPRGRDNLRISYETGGGAAGNVPAGAVGEIEGSLAFVDSVTNPVSGDGAADAETSQHVLERAPRQIRDRDRAVAPADYERLAKASARELARARCLPGLSPDGQYGPGWVTVLVVPHSTVRKPVPSASLKEQVTAGLADHVPAAVLGDLGDERLVVRGPSYVAVTVEATVVAGAVESLSALEAAAADALEAFLHPLTGGEDGEGWPFGELPCVSDCFGVLEGVAGVDHVADLALHFETPAATRTIRPGQDPPSVGPDALSHSGLHDLDVVGGA